MDERGASVIEVLVAAVIVAIAATSVFGVAAATLRAQTDLDPFEAAAASVESLQSALKNYVAADRSDPSWGPNGSWSLPGDVVADALALGVTHDGSRFLDPRLVRARPGARLSYVVTAPYGADGPLAVDFSVSYQ